LGFFGF